MKIKSTKSIVPLRVSNSLVLKTLKYLSLSCEPYIEKIKCAYIDYIKHKGSPSLLRPIGLPDIIADELYELYEGKAEKYGLRWIGKYRLAERLSHCPLCGNPGPSQLEHYLPRSSYSEYTIFSWNLIPSCGLCNGKRNKYANAPNVAIPLVHPYFDIEIINQAVVSADILPPYEAIRFKAKIVGPYSVALRFRLENHYEKCLHKERLKTHLSSRWSVWRGKASEHPNIEGLIRSLEIEYHSSIGPLGSNSWDVIFLRSLLSDFDALKWLWSNKLDVAGSMRISAQPQYSMA